jgi:hypothetical protein
MTLYGEIRSRGGLVALAALAVLLVALLLAQRESGTPDVTGEYESACCGSFEMANGVIFVSGNRVPFTLERDKFGLYALPTKFVGVDDSSIVITNRHPNLLRFNDEVLPSSIKLPRENRSGFAEFEIRLPPKFE